MLTVIKPSLFSFGLNVFRFGPSFTAVGQLGLGGHQGAASVPRPLTIPWHDIQETPDLFSLLTWHSRLTSFAGREKELEELKRWATSAPRISVKLMAGDGGTGKSRLAAEFAVWLREQKWEAGFVDLRSPVVFPHRKKGTLFVIDYPEQQRECVRELFRDLAGLELPTKGGPLRVLLLSRHNLAYWIRDARDSGAAALIEQHELWVAGLDATDAYRIFCSAQESAADCLRTTPMPFQEEEITAWLKAEPENDLPLFVVAAGVHNALTPHEPIVNYKGREIIGSLVEWELTRLRRVADAIGLDDSDAIARLLALVSIAGRLSLDTILDFDQCLHLGLGVPSVLRLREVLLRSGLLRDGHVAAPEPDIVAAAMTATVLDAEPMLAPERMWAVLEGNPESVVDRIGRLSYDLEFTLGITRPSLTEWLIDAFRDDVNRSAAFDSAIARDPRRMPLPLVPAAIAATEKLLTSEENPARRVQLLSDLAQNQEVIGNTRAGLEAAEEAVRLCRALTPGLSAAWDQVLATCLSRQAACLRELGQPRSAMGPITEAVGIFRRLAAILSSFHEPSLASNLVLMAAVLRDAGDIRGGLSANEEAISIYRRLVASEPRIYQPPLATALSNEALSLRDLGLDQRTNRGRGSHSHLPSVST